MQPIREPLPQRPKGAARSWRALGMRSALLMTALHGPVAGGGTAGAAIPDVLRAPAGQALFLSLRGVGVQVYQCAAAKDDVTHFSWQLTAPDAVLRNAAGGVVGRHYGGPTWQASDGSRVVGEVVAKRDSADTGAIPWLLLRAKSTTGAGAFGGISTIQRLNTAGGTPPAEVCDASQAGKQVRVPYAADYRFYVPAVTSPLGLWKTIDDKTGKPRAVVRIYAEDGRLFGKIEQSFTPASESRTCALCTDERKNQPIIGLIIIRGMKPDGDEYDGGDILDPESGSVYRCKMHVETAGTRLILRGYIGFSLLGRTQTWQRQE